MGLPSDNWVLKSVPSCCPEAAWSRHHGLASTASSLLSLLLLQQFHYVPTLELSNNIFSSQESLCFPQTFQIRKALNVNILSTEIKLWILIMWPKNNIFASWFCFLIEKAFCPSEEVEFFSRCDVHLHCLGFFCQLLKHRLPQYIPGKGHTDHISAWVLEISLLKENLEYGTHKRDIPQLWLKGRRKGSSTMFQLLGASCTSIYSEFQGRQRVLPEALGDTVQSHQAEAARKTS